MLAWRGTPDTTLRSLSLKQVQDQTVSLLLSSEINHVPDVILLGKKITFLIFLPPDFSLIFEALTVD